MTIEIALLVLLGNVLYQISYGMRASRGRRMARAVDLPDDHPVVKAYLEALAESEWNSWDDVPDDYCLVCKGECSLDPPAPVTTQ